MTDLEARIRIAQLRLFYEDILSYGMINVALVLIWLFFSESWSFWPGWVLLGWGIVLLRRALVLEVFSLRRLTERFPLFGANWEAQELQKLTAKTDDAPPPQVAMRDLEE